MYVDTNNTNSQQIYIYVFVLLIIITIAFGPKLLQIGAGITALTILLYILFRTDFCEGYLVSGSKKTRNNLHKDEELLGEETDDSELYDDDMESSVRNAATYDNEFMRGDDLNGEYGYGRNSREKYTNCRNPVPQSVENCYKNAQGSFDEQAMRMSTLRQRDREAIEGAATKNANAYKRFFGDELNKAENERWWGNIEL